MGSSQLSPINTSTTFSWDQEFNPYGKQPTFSNQHIDNLFMGPGV